jgi:CBS domain-containing protein
VVSDRDLLAAVAPGVDLPDVRRGPVTIAPEASVVSAVRLMDAMHV